MSKDKNDLTFFEHLEDLRWHIIRSFVAIVVVAIVIFLMKNWVFNEIILKPKDADFLTYRLLCKFSEQISSLQALCLDDVLFTVTNIDMAGQFLVHVKTSFLMGLVVVFPFVLWELWRFIRPALRPQEQKNSALVIFSSSTLFYIGVTFGYFLLTPFSINFLGTYAVSEQVSNDINLSSYIAILTMLVIASGLMFEMPIIIYFLSVLGLLTPESMRLYRKHSLVGILLLSAIITPPDITSQIVIALPLYFLYEIGIFVSARASKKYDDD